MLIIRVSLSWLWRSWIAEPPQGPHLRASPKGCPPVSPSLSSSLKLVSSVLIHYARVCWLLHLLAFFGQIHLYGVLGEDPPSIFLQCLNLGSACHTHTGCSLLLPPKKYKYGKPEIGESLCILVALDIHNICLASFLTAFWNHCLFVRWDETMGVMVTFQGVYVFVDQSGQWVSRRRRRRGRGGGEEGGGGVEVVIFSVSTRKKPFIFERGHQTSQNCNSNIIPWETSLTKRQVKYKIYQLHHTQYTNTVIHKYKFVNCS